MACKFAIVILTIRVRVGLKLTNTLSFRLVLSLPRKVLSPALEKVANPDRSEAADVF